MTDINGSAPETTIRTHLTDLVRGDGDAVWVLLFMLGMFATVFGAFAVNRVGQVIGLLGVALMLLAGSKSTTVFPPRPTPEDAPGSD